ncbi:MAG: hypothetical protein AAGH68_07555 [Pseudomonadota bacterium]
MARKTGKSGTRKKGYSTTARTPAHKPQKLSRREMLGLARFGVLGAAVVGGGGYYLVSNIIADAAETDLSKVGNGLPTIVQVHDPACPDCRALQNSAREALEAFEDTELQYLVANLQSAEGRQFANRYGAGRVTLLLFDATGEMRDVVQGRTSSQVLQGVFRRLADAG